MLSVTTVNHCYTQQVVFEKKTNKLKSTGGTLCTWAWSDRTNLAPCFIVRFEKRHPVSDSKAKKYTLIGGTSPYGTYMALHPREANPPNHIFHFILVLLFYGSTKKTVSRSYDQSWSKTIVAQLYKCLKFMGLFCTVSFLSP